MNKPGSFYIYLKKSCIHVQNECDFVMDGHTTGKPISMPWSYLKILVTIIGVNKCCLGTYLHTKWLKPILSETTRNSSNKRRMIWYWVQYMGL